MLHRGACLGDEKLSSPGFCGGETVSTPGTRYSRSSRVLGPQILFASTKVLRTRIDKREFVLASARDNE